MEALGTNTKHGPCCICTKKNKICTRNCEFAAYFPNEVYIFSYTLYVFSVNVLS